LLKNVKYFKVNFAIYSPREGTYSWRYLEDDVPKEIKVKRINYLIDLQKKINIEINKTLVGKETKIILESFNSKDTITYGRSMDNRIVGLNENLENLIGEEVKVKITKATPGPLYGERIT
jgi:tRNA-2-methylthio-N6-dimethylallyladenosine synthase